MLKQLLLKAIVVITVLGVLLAACSPAPTPNATVPPMLTRLPSASANTSAPASATTQPASGVTPTAATPALANSDDGKILFLADRDGDKQPEIYRIKAQGGGQTLVAKIPIPFADAPYVWSPDGTHLALLDNGRSDRPTNLFLMNMSDTSLASLPIGQPALPVWSPDSRQVVFSSCQGTCQDFNYEIFVVNADGTELTNISNNPAPDMAPVWSPDSSQIAFSFNRDNVSSLFVINRDGTGLKKLVTFPTGLLPYVSEWPYDGTPMIVYATNTVHGSVSSANGPTPTPSCDTRKYSLNTDGTGLTDLGCVNVVNEGVLAWSPDRQRKAFSAQTENGKMGVFVTNTDGSRRFQLSDNWALMGLGSPLSWSPDSARLVYVSEINDDINNAQLFTVKVDGTERTQLTNNPGGVFCPIWVP